MFFLAADAAAEPAAESFAGCAADTDADAEDAGAAAEREGLETAAGEEHRPPIFERRDPPKGTPLLSKLESSAGRPVKVFDV